VPPAELCKAPQDQLQSRVLCRLRSRTPPQHQIGRPEGCGWDRDRHRRADCTAHNIQRL